MSSFPIWFMLIALKVPPLLMIALLWWAAKEEEGPSDEGGGGGGGSFCPDDGQRLPPTSPGRRGCQGRRARLRV